MFFLVFVGADCPLSLCTLTNAGNQSESESIADGHLREKTSVLCALTVNHWVVDAILKLHVSSMEKSREALFLCSILRDYGTLHVLRSMH